MDHLLNTVRAICMLSRVCSSVAAVPLRSTISRENREQWSANSAKRPAMLGSTSVRRPGNGLRVVVEAGRRKPGSRTSSVVSGSIVKGPSPPEVRKDVPWFGGFVLAAGKPTDWKNLFSRNHLVTSSREPYRSFQRSSGAFLPQELRPPPSHRGGRRSHRPPRPFLSLVRASPGSSGPAWGISVPSPWGPRGTYGRGASEDPGCRVAISMEPQHGHPPDRVHASHVPGSVHHRPRSVVHPTIRLHVSGNGAPPVGHRPRCDCGLRRVPRQGHCVLVRPGDGCHGPKSLPRHDPLPEGAPRADLHPGADVEGFAGAARDAADGRRHEAIVPFRARPVVGTRRAVDSRQTVADRAPRTRLLRPARPLRIRFVGSVSHRNIPFGINCRREYYSHEGVGTDDGTTAGVHGFLHRRRIVAMGTLPRLRHATVRSRELEGPRAPASLGIGVACRTDSSRVPRRERSSGPNGPWGRIHHRKSGGRGLGAGGTGSGLSRTVPFRRPKPPFWGARVRLLSCPLPIL